MPPTLDRWSVKDSADLYGIKYWSKGLFEINEAGEVCARLRENGSTQAVSMLEIIDGLRKRGMDLPILLRFPDFIDSQIEEINEAFAKAMRDGGYKGTYRGVYPIKVNQQEQVVREVARAGRKYNFGLEAGSKAELVAAPGLPAQPRRLHHLQRLKDAEFMTWPSTA
jgi:arginine decarboxylase